VGRNQKFVKELHKALGGKGTFEAPTHRTSYDWETTGRRVTSSREYVSEFVVIFEDTPAHRHYKPADLAPLFAARYADSGLTEPEWLAILQKVEPKAKRRSYNWNVDLDPLTPYTDAEITEVMQRNLNEPTEFFYKVSRPSTSKGLVIASQIRYEVPTKTVEKLTGKVRRFPSPRDRDYKTFMATDVAPRTQTPGASPSTRPPVLIDVHVLKTEDWLGKDEVYVKATGPGGVEKTRVVGLNDGQRHTFGLSAKAFGDFSRPVVIEVYDEDCPDADDLIVRMSWSPPFSPVRNTRSYDEANYQITARRA
jgi:hypothetical protein